MHTIPSHPQLDASFFHLDLKVRTHALKLPMLSKSSPKSSLLSVKHDLKDYISWRVQFALLPPSCATLKQALGNLTSKYVLRVAFVPCLMSIGFRVRRSHIFLGYINHLFP
jgi:hypothetical protein